MKKIFISFISLLLTLSTFGQWTNLSHSLLSGYVDNGMVYTGSAVNIATNGGIFRSTNNGSTWQKSNTGLDSTDIGINDITYFNNKVWVVSNGLYSSSDNGGTWIKNQLNNLNSLGYISDVAKKGSLLFINYNFFDTILSTQISVICYSSDGLNWSYGDTISIGFNVNWKFLNDNDYALFLTNSNLDTLFYTFNGTVLNILPKTGLPANSKMNSRYFSIDPLGNNFFYTNNSIYKYNFSTQSWVEKTNGISSYAAILKTHSLGNLCFTSTFNLVPTPSIILYYSLDTASTWVGLTNPGLLLPAFNGSMIKAGSNRILSSDLFNDLYATDDNGLSWTKNTNIMSLDFSDFVVANNILFAQRDKYGLFKSADNGSTWSQFNGDLPSFMTIYFTNEIISDGSALYVTSATQPDGPQNIYKSTNSGVNWTELTAAPDSSRPVFSALSGGKLFVQFNNNNGIGTYQFSPDQGSTWFNLTPAINALNLNRVYGFKANTDTLFLFGLNNSNLKKIYISVDNGLSFTYFTTGLDVPDLEIIIGNEYDITKTTPIAAFINNHDLIVVARNSGVFPNQIRFYQFNTQQNKWTEVPSNGIDIPNNARIFSLQYRNGIWYLASSIGIYVSIDNCQNWSKVWNNQGLQLGMRNKSCLISNNYIFLGTDGTGIWKTQISQPALITNAVVNISGIKAISGGNITSTGGFPYIAKGICWATHSGPTLSDSFKYSSLPQNYFSDTLTGLSPQTPYFVRAFVISYNDTIYGNELTFTTFAIINPQLNPTSGDYGLSNPSYVQTIVMWNDASSIVSIVDNQSTTYTLTTADYTINNSLLRINQSYLATVLTTGGQTDSLTINFNVGNPVVFTINAVQIAANSASIFPNTLIYDLELPNSKNATITWNDASSITSIVDNQTTPYTLQTPADYYVSGNNIIIYQTYFASVFTASGQSITLTVNFNVGNPVNIVINSIETITNASINPTSDIFIINAPLDVKTKITWNSADSIISIVDNQLSPYTLQKYNDYSVSSDTLTIFASYLSNVLINVSDSIKLTINFNKGSFIKFKITGVVYVGIDELQNNIELYPNPVSDYLYISSKMEENAVISVFNLNGQKIFESTQKNRFSIIDVSSLSNGTYLLRYKTDKHLGIFKFNIIK